ncbi:MAG: hypothetical protein KatS3mg057_1883 [Herpetosiphonaceae bacterium]|nr:MAG: hypothetical protein KatS3mg057_1883 [Herpetosiphonaceae bacterium]
MASSSGLRSQTPHLPTYREARHLLRILNGVSAGLYRKMAERILEQRGSPQAPEDWTNPDIWIEERLAGDERLLAQRIWKESQGELNPRHTRGGWWLANRHYLLEQGSDDILRLTERGKDFLAKEISQVVIEIDNYEGLIEVLQLVAERGPGRRSDFLPQYISYCRTITTAHSESVIKSFLYNRLVNLIDRGYISRRGQIYEVTDAGLSYLRNQATGTGEKIITSEQSELLKLAANISRESRAALANQIATMNPFKFEDLINLLLQEMGYTDVETTTPVNDKGVDLVANIELGISSVREVVQVKRHKGNINRKTLDELRGSLHRFSAVRGTIITTGGFSRGTIEAAFERGAAPITLIDGEKLLDLLIQYQIGVTKKSVEYIEFDPKKLEQFTEQDKEEQL